MGKYGSEEAQSNYRRFVAEWAAIGDVTDPHKSYMLLSNLYASVAQLAEHGIRNAGVMGSTPIAGFLYDILSR